MPKASSTKNIKQIVRKELSKHLETKHMTHLSDWTEVGNVVGSLTNLTEMAQGVGDQQRIGNRVTLTKLYIRKLFRFDPSGTGATTSSGALRVILAQSRGGPLAKSDFPGYYQPIDLDKMIVIKDSMMNLSGPGAVSGASYSASTFSKFEFKVDTKKIPCKNLQYNDTNVEPDRPVYLFMFAENGNIQQAGFEQCYYKDA